MATAFDPEIPGCPGRLDLPTAAAGRQAPRALQAPRDVRLQGAPRAGGAAKGLSHPWGGLAGLAW